MSTIRNGKRMKTFDLTKLTNSLQRCKEVDFAYLFGSSQNGIISDGSDVDVAVHINCKATFNVYSKLIAVVEKVVGTRADISILNSASAVLGMQALQGKHLFCRDKKFEKYLDFYTYTCRKYEDEIFHMELQLKYRGY